MRAATRIIRRLSRRSIRRMLPAGIGAGKKSSDGKEGKKTTEKPKGEKKLRFSFKEQREWDTIEDTIAAVEEKMRSGCTDRKKCQQLYEIE